MDPRGQRTRARHILYNIGLRTMMQNRSVLYMRTRIIIILSTATL